MRFIYLSILLAASTVDSVPFDSAAHFPYEPFGVTPVRERSIPPTHSQEVKAVSVKLASRKSGVKEVKADASDDYDMAEDAVFRAVEQAEGSLLSAFERAERAAVHAIEDEVDALFHKDPNPVVQVKDIGEEKMADKDVYFHAVEKMYD